MTFAFDGFLWQHEAPGGWHFVTLPEKVSAEIKHLYGEVSPGFGSLPVQVRVGGTLWDTSAFYDTKAGAYLLPVKSDIRKKEGIKAGDRIEVEITVNR